MIAQRFLLAAVTGLLLELAGTAVAGLIVPGSEPFIMVACGVGLLLAALWFWDDFKLLIATLVLSGIVGWLAYAMDLHAAGGHGLRTAAPDAVPLAPSAAALLVAGAVAVSSLSGWMLFRAREPWPVAALIGSCLLLRADVSAVYGDRFPLFAIGLLLLVGLAYAGRSRVGRRVALVLLLSAASVGLAWALPTSVPAWSHNLADPVRSLLARHDDSRVAQSLTLSGPFHPHNRAVMTVAIRGNFHPYWRTETFDQYDGHAWHLTGYSVDRVRGGLTLFRNMTVQNHVYAAAVHILDPTQLLVFPGLPVVADRTTLTTVRTGDGEPLAVSAESELPAGSIYDVEGLLVAPGRAASFSGPQPDLSPYLQLPSIPDEVRAEAERLTRGGTTLSKVRRVERYLAASGKFTYDEQAGSPTDRDAVDDFLFRSHRGYCNQFASAMVVLLRSVNIPARLVGGYVTGSRVGHSFLVRDRDRHSWVEAYIPAVGWVPFEPTPGFALDARLTLQGTGRAEPIPPTPVPNPTQQPTRPPVQVAKPAPPVPRPASGGTSPTRFVPAGILILVLTCLCAGALVWRRRARSVQQIYRRLARTRTRPSARIRPHETPSEFARRVATKRADAVLIGDLYARERYGGPAIDEHERSQARDAWRRLRRDRWLGR